ncbi:MAG TPA: methylenetetrahydrofolate reductase [Fibrobacteraceae bacterium]|nr:methylenetetrahydrofolate reductase [Fibrobacteraceae bacterium]
MTSAQPAPLPNQIALELVPNSFDGLLQESALAKVYPQIQAINIPEMRSKEIKGHHAAEALLKAGYNPIPHFRTIDRTYAQLESLIAPLIPLGLQSVLLISGDPINSPEFHASDLTPLNAIPRLKQAFPGLRIYTGFDPYRQSFQSELEYCMRKLEAGSDGFYTQPFFSEFFLQVWLEQLQHTEVWVGVSPVTTPSFKGYWEKTNHVPFPPDFDLSMEGNCQNERTLLQIARQYAQKAYLMPITVSVEKYLPLLLG